MRPTSICAILTIFGSVLVAQTAGSARLGIYHWGGTYPHSINEGVTAIANLGGHVARVAVSPRYYRDYNIAQTCYPNFTLTAAAQEPDVRKAFDNPAIDVFILTAYDGTTFGDCQTPNFMNPAFLTPDQTAAVVQEYSDFTLYLYRTYQHTSKRFLVSNWESDNSIYCDQAYTFATDPAFQEECRARYLTSYGIGSPEEALQGLKLWLQSRAEGIRQGRLRAAAEGITGVRVYHAPEINIVRALREHGLPSVLYDVLPSVRFDYVSYSAWESLAAPDPVAALPADLDMIQSVTGSRAILIGELGFSRQSWEGQDVSRSAQAIASALAWGVAYVIQWQLYDSDAIHAFGLYDLSGQPTPLADWFRSQFRQTLRSVRPTRPTPLAPETPWPRD